MKSGASTRQQADLLSSLRHHSSTRERDTRIRSPQSSRNRWRSLLWLLLVTTVPSIAYAQITITNSVFPAVGDTLHFAVDNNPGPAIVVTPPGGNQNWDFSSLQRSASWSEVMRPAATGTSAGLFPGATLVYTQTGPTRFPGLPGSNGAETYLNVTGSQVQLLGFGGGSGVLGLGRQEVIRFSPAMNVATAPTSFFDIRSFTSSVTEEFSGEPIPGVDLPFSASAFRLRATIDQLGVVDASGTLTIPGGTFEVLREKRTTSAVVRLDALIPPLGWLDVTDLFEGADLQTEIGDYDQVSYRYLGTQSKEEIAIMQGPLVNRSHGSLDPLTIASVQYKDLASPVPEAETFAMMLAGLGLLVAWRSAGSRHFVHQSVKRGASAAPKLVDGGVCHLVNDQSVHA